MTAGRHVNTLSQSWRTPPKYVRAIKDFWGGRIGLDPCSNEYSIVHAKDLQDQKIGVDVISPKISFDRQHIEVGSF